MKEINSNDIINMLIAKELEQYKSNYEIRPVPYSQDIGSLSIAWFCYYCKGKISRENKNAICEFAKNVLNSKEYEKIGWSRIPAILAASYVLTEEENYLNELVNNLDCHQSVNREFIMKCTAIICPKIPSENEYFRNAVEMNLIKRQGLAEIGVILYLNSNGDEDEKMKWLKEISENKAVRSDNTIIKLINGDSISNDFCKDTLSEIKSYILFRILNNDYDIQECLFENTKISKKSLLRSIDDHPLSKGSFQI